MAKLSFISRQQTYKSINPVQAVAATIPAIAGIVLMCLIPAVLNIVISFTDYNGVWERTAFVGLENYINFFTALREDVFDAFKNTLIYAALVVLPLQVVALGAALLVNIKSRLSNFFRAVYFMPNILGTAVICSIWSMIFDPIDGVAANILKIFGAQSAFLGDEKISLVLISLIAIWSSFGYSMAIYLAGLKGVPDTYYEAAVIDGASSWQIFWKITLPLIWPAVTICLYIALQGTLGMSEYIIFLTNGAYGTRTIGFYIYNLTMTNAVNQGQTAAISIYNFAFVSTIMLLFKKYIRKQEEEL